MKQVLQNYKTGKLSVENVPSPIIKSNGILVQSKCSLISTGTERSKIVLASQNIIAKAKSRPDQVKMVMNNLKQEGFFSTMRKALIKLDTPISLGYSCSGEIIDLGKEVNDYKISDRVACFGEGLAAHAEINSVPVNMCARIPEKVSYRQASFVGLGAIAMQGVRNANVQKGSKVGVIGLGLLGQISVQILKAFDCEVIGIDLDDYKLSVAKGFGVQVGNSKSDNIESLTRSFSDDTGLDAVIITAASKDSKPLELAARIAKKYGKIVLVGLVPINIPRKEFFDKELSFVVSRGFGDESLSEDLKIDQQKTIFSARKNAENFLNLISKGLVNVEKLISKEFNINQAKNAYELLAKDNKSLGIIINYSGDLEKTKNVFTSKKQEIKKGVVNIGFIGAGSFSMGYLLPILAKNKKAYLRAVSASRGLSSKNIADKFNFDYATSENREIFNDKNIEVVVIATRHNLHASFVISGLKNNKIVFVEKPLCVTEEELNQIIKTYKETRGQLMIGFNRRFSPFTLKLKEFYKNRTGPLIINYRVNAGRLDDEHWLNNLSEGGGRIIGEVCHFVDLLQFITESDPARLFAEATQNSEEEKSQNFVITIKYKDNSVGTINYNAIGDSAFPREKIEVFGQDSVCVIDNFRSAKFTRNNRTSRMTRFNRDMGYQNEINSFINCILNKEKMPIDFKDIASATYLTFKIIDSLRISQPVVVDFKNI